MLIPTCLPALRVDYMTLFSDRTGSAFDIYSDPDRSLYEKLGMGQMGSLWHEANVEAPSYHERGFLGDFTAAIKVGFSIRKSFTPRYYYYFIDQV